MDAFLGKWKQQDAPTNGEAFLVAAGSATDEYIDYMNKIRATVDYEKDGDGCKVTFTDEDTSQSQSYSFKLGEPFESTDLLGRKYKMVVTMESPTKIKEACTEWSESEITTTREVIADTIVAIFTVKGVTSECVFKKVQ